MPDKQTTGQRGASGKILARLEACPKIAATLPANARIVGAGRNGGGWSWVIEGEDFQIGSEHPRREVADAPGLFFSLVSFDQIECSPWPDMGIVLDWHLDAELARHSKRKGTHHG
ncbi:hypothetical protein HLH33_18735 [Gluconacetobacter diazotrophicus]|uniref:Uncharacterized protein n=1 Tax=Gluconacetobacter diazotrophicus TaxID=33996 RepID=A0A7W4I8S7_GLUDI|nr:hypothetical protein [Gluconacetobacter diazotrophicus]MBB2158302.1 hypothetical protein [Gluconacetobacter diazotrophicus]